MGGESNGPQNENRRALKKALESRTFKDGGIYLYQRGDYKKPTWYIRLKIPGTRGYLWRSSGTTSEHEAYKVAEDLYNLALVKVLSGAKLNAKRISEALEKYISALEPERQRTSIHYKILFAERLIPIFQKRTFDELDTALISQMIEALAERSNKQALSPNTVKRLFADFRHFLSWSLEQGYLEKFPVYPKISASKNRRPHFDRNDYRRLTRYLQEFVKEGPASVKRDRALLRDYVLILANSGLRTGEARYLKWRDIRPFNSADGTENIAITVRGKTGQREAVTQPAAKSWFQRIYERRKQDLGDPRSDLANAKAIPPDSYVFCGRDGKPIGSFKKSFNSLIKRAGVEFDSFGNKRTLYSLRHTYATFRLQEGVNQYLVARNMGTSVAMLEEFYGHTSNVLAAAELTKVTRGRSGGAGGATSSGLDWLESK